MAALYLRIYVLNLLGQISAYNKEKTINFIVKCQNKNGGLGGSIGHDSNLHQHSMLY